MITAMSTNLQNFKQNDDLNIFLLKTEGEKNYRHRMGYFISDNYMINISLIIGYIL